MSAVRIYIVLVLMLCSLGLTAQNFVTISGKVVDADTGDPLVFVSVGLQGKSIGTISNTIGEFDFHIPIEDQNGVLELNILGYETYSAKVSDILSNDIRVFSLKRTIQILDEIIVSDTLTGGDIFTIGINRIEKNYPMEPFILDAFYRDLKSVGGTYVGLLEAAVKIYDRDYDEPRAQLRLRERVGLIEVRKSLGYDNKFTSFFDHTNLLEDLLLHNNVRYRQFPSNEKFLNQLERKEISFYNGRRVFIIELKDSNRLRFYIDALTYAFIRIEYELGPSSEIIDRKSGLVSRMHSLTKIIEFKEFAGKMYLSHMDLISEVHWVDDKADELKFTTQLHQQLMVNKINPRTRQIIGSTESMKKYGLQYQHRNYNKPFWDNYNVIKDTPLDKKIVEDLEKEMTLEKQFQDH